MPQLFFTFLFLRCLTLREYLLGHMRLTSRYAIAILFALCICVAVYGVLIGRFGLVRLSLVHKESPVPRTEYKQTRDLVKTETNIKESDFIQAFPGGIKYDKLQEGDIFPKIRPFLKNGTERVTLTAEAFRSVPDVKTGNSLIDDYGKNDLGCTGEMGRGALFIGEEADMVESHMNKLNINGFASDLIPLHRTVPDSRPDGCSYLKYPLNLPTASVVITFHNEWPSVLLRSIYSIINRSPRHLLKEIVLVDDASSMAELGKPLDDYISAMFPVDLVKVIHLQRRAGLIKARLIGWQKITGDVLVIFDGHMEVNHFWLEPLLYEIKQDRQIVALSTLDYIKADTFRYEFNTIYQPRYAFDWRLTFFETYFRKDMTWDLTGDQSRDGVVTVGTALAVDSAYFKEIGAYDEGMETWGGENIELSWRVWMCGGRMVHVPCSHVGHIARPQPYIFPKGRTQTEIYNYKRAVDVWMDPVHKDIVYSVFPMMKTLDSGDISNRLALKESLQCKNFSWFLDAVWPELTVFPDNALAWGGVFNRAKPLCLDNNDYLFQGEEALYAKPCIYSLPKQGFSWKRTGELRTSLQCVVVKQNRVVLEDCFLQPDHQWKHERDGQLMHVRSHLCLDIDEESGDPVMRECSLSVPTQRWAFRHYI